MTRSIDYEYIGFKLEPINPTRYTTPLAFSVGFALDQWHVKLFVTGFKYVASVRLGVVD